MPMLTLHEFLKSPPHGFMPIHLLTKAPAVTASLKVREGVTVHYARLDLLVSWP
jgi:hypothetical protein